MSGAPVVPPAVRQQAQAMADAEQQVHYIIREGDAWLITPTTPAEMPDGAVFPNARPVSRWAGIGL